MKKILAFIAVPIGFLAIAAYLIYLNRDGWGWCLLLAAITAPTEYSEK